MNNEEFEKKILEKIRSGKYVKPDLTIQRLPEKTKQEFIRLCDEDFSSDYGMGIKWLLDFYTGLMPSSNEAVLSAIEALEQRLIVLEGKYKAEEEKPVEKLKTKLDGRVIIK